MPYARLTKYAEFREFFGATVLRDLKSQFVNSYLGMAWLLIEPLLLVLSLSAVFILIERPGTDGVPFPIFFYAAVLPWNLVKRCFVNGTQVFRKDSALISKFAFPRELCVFKLVLTEFINFLFASLAFMLLLLYYRWTPGISWLFLLPLVGVQLVFSTGLMLLTGSLFVFVRDVGILVGTLGTLWFWFTPVVFAFPFEGPAKYLYYFNPMAGMIAAYRQIILQNQVPDFSLLVPMLVVAPVLLVLGGLVFHGLEKRFVDEF